MNATSSRRGARRKKSRSLELAFEAKVVHWAKGLIGERQIIHIPASIGVPRALHEVPTFMLPNNRQHNSFIDPKGSSELSGEIS